MTVPELKSALTGFRGTLRENVPLAPLTHVRLGGPAKLFAEPFAAEDVALVVRACRDTGTPLYVLGGGSNLLIADAGVDGLVLALAPLHRVVRDGNRVTAGAGASLPALIRNTRELGLAGLETLIGIPAMVGGAVAMNAGTRTGETFDHLESLVLVGADGAIRACRRDELQPRYRDGGIGEQVVVEATFALQEDDPARIFERVDDALRRRRATQPVTEKSVGCVFQNPPGDAAGRLIEAAGLKLQRRGGISVSGLHANYFVNDGTGTTRDFLELIADVRRTVRDRFGVELATEVRMWGVRPG
jgi:UDP-N-acetylmuramate dehydrogenase